MAVEFSWPVASKLSTLKSNKEKKKMIYNEACHTSAASKAVR